MITARIEKTGYYDYILTSTNHNKVVGVKYYEASACGKAHWAADHLINNRRFFADSYLEILEKLNKKGW